MRNTETYFETYAILMELWRIHQILDANSVVIMDNARIHKTAETQALIQASGAEVLYLPPYSPDYNPVAVR